MAYRTKTALAPSNLPGLEYALNPYRGCSHGCVYCYAPDILRMSGEDEWGSSVDIKEGLPNVLAKELKKKEKGTIGLGTVTDPYQIKEERANNTRYCLEQIARKKWMVCIQTKSDLVTRDIDILSGMEGVEVGITITTLDEELARRIEPGAPSPQRRLDALRALVDDEIRTWVFLGPIIPTMNDSEDGVEGLLEAVHDAGVREILYDRLRLKPLLRERMGKAFEQDEGIEMDAIFKMANDPGWWRLVSTIIETKCQELGIMIRKAF